jgi:demethylmenaquinone methyltransferase/2-methoxy-6-polyprenyl-1,4-benzoquinol methylase
MFDRIAGVYDLMNRVMTAGLDSSWRARTVERAALAPGDTALDVCCGTGDLAVELAGAVGPSGRVDACDFSERMLELAREKQAELRAEGSGRAPIEFRWADALELPYEDDAYDAVTVGFGARNLADLDRGLGEMSRVLHPGGRLVVLEITQPQRPPLSTFFSLWFERVVPLLGTLAGDRDAYSYLPDSVRSFPSPERLGAMMDENGLTDVRWLVLAGGIIAIHSGVKRTGTGGKR